MSPNLSLRVSSYVDLINANFIQKTPFSLYEVSRFVNIIMNIKWADLECKDTFAEMFNKKMCT